MWCALHQLIHEIVCIVRNDTRHIPDGIPEIHDGVQHGQRMKNIPDDAMDNVVDVRHRLRLVMLQKQHRQLILQQRLQRQQLEVRSYETI